MANEDHEKTEYTSAGFDKNSELVKTQLEMLERLSLAAKYKDDDTGSHITRMSRYCYEIVKAYGFNDEDATCLLNAARNNFV